MKKVIYRARDASISEDTETGALEYKYLLGGIRWTFSLWAEVGEKAYPLFASFWRDKGIRSPLLELGTYDHGPVKPYISDTLPPKT